MESTTAARETYNAMIQHAVRLPIPGVLKTYRTTEFDDFGNSQVVFIRSTEHANENGEITWTTAR